MLEAEHPAYRVRLAINPSARSRCSTRRWRRCKNRYACCWPKTPPERRPVPAPQNQHPRPLRRAWRDAEAQGAFDTLFFNERGELTEGGRSSVFVRVNGKWLTPPLSSGVLPGVMRSVLLDDPAWNASEAVITRAMLDAASDIVICNALRGAVRAAVTGR
jgi:para-aminobenzoate synthetase/4-amino-4-deoxychorismate lyase